MYNKIIVDHFMNPRHAGKLEDANGVGIIGDPGCGDFMCIFIKVEDWQVKNVSFLCKGCPAAIASGSATAELAYGKPLEKVMALTPEDVSRHLGGLPEEKLHCSNLGVDALRYAIADFLGILPESDDGSEEVTAAEE